MKALASILYLLAYFTVLVLIILVIATVERRWGFHTLYRQGDIDGMVAALVIGGVIFTGSTLVLARLSPPVRGLKDHLQQSAGVYAIIIATAIYVVTRIDQRDSLGYGVAVGACLVGLYAVILNGLIVWFQGRRTARHYFTPAISSNKPSRSP